MHIWMIKQRDMSKFQYQSNGTYETQNIKVGVKA